MRKHVKKAMHDGGWADRPGVPALLSCQFDRHGNGLSAEAQTVVFHELNLQEELAFNNNGYSDGSMPTQSCQVNCRSVFARRMHSTSEFAMIVLSKCVHEASM